MQIVLAGADGALAFVSPNEYDAALDMMEIVGADEGLIGWARLRRFTGWGVVRDGEMEIFFDRFGLDPAVQSLQFIDENYRREHILDARRKAAEEGYRLTPPFYG